MSETAAPPLSVLVLGGGTMGSGIAQLFTQRGARVQVSELDDASAEKARATVLDGLSRWARKNSVDAAGLEEATSRLTVAAGLPEGPFDLVVESVPEDVDLKRALLQKLSAQYPDAVLATNTSALSIDTLAEAVQGPERFIGYHFFNPVPLSLLLEVVIGAATSPQTLDAARRHAELLGLTAIEVKDSPGFATSRLGVALGLEAIRMVEEGIASAEDIDRGMVLGYKLPIGPLHLTDLVGIDTRLSISEHLHSTLGARFEPPALMRRLVEQGRHGRKTGRGFYHWDGGTRGAPADQD